MVLDTLLLLGPGPAPLLGLLEEAGLHPTTFDRIPALVSVLEQSPGIIILGRAPSASELGELQQALAQQPSWSDRPIVAIDLPVNQLEPMEKVLGNLHFLPEKADPRVIVAAVRRSLRERRRQLEFRDASQVAIETGASLEALVQTRTADLQRTIKSLESFCYTVAHDLRAPLRGLQGFATALVEDYAEALEGDGKDYAHRIVAAAARMDRLIQDLLAYSRLDKLDLTMARVELEASVDAVLMSMAKEIKAARAEVRVHRPLPMVWSHPLVLEQIITHLVSNALKFVAARITPQVEIRGEETAETARLWVVDNGIGIDPRNHEKIFNVFERLHGEETYPGTGIGLALVRKAALRVGGESGVESLLGRGSRFWVQFPRKAPATTGGSRL